MYIIHVYMMLSHYAYYWCVLFLFSQNRFPRRRVTNGVLEFSLPEGVYACDMAVFTIWDRLALSHFTGINIPANLFVSCLATFICTSPMAIRESVDSLCRDETDAPMA